MTIRSRLTFWYGGIMFVSLLLMIGLSYHEFVVEPRSRPPGKLVEAQEDQAEDAEDIFGILLWCGLPAVALALGGGWWLMRKTLAPVASLTQAAERINERNLGEQLPRSGSGDELDRLTEVFNAMTARLGGSFQRVREFTLHASHELKTPLTVLHGELETELQNENLSAEQREHLVSKLDEVQRLTKIVDGLTLLTKADAGQISLNREKLSLDELVSDAVADAQILAKPFEVSVKLEKCEPASITGDRHRLRQMLLNLTDNAIKYNHPGGTVSITLGQTKEGAEITIVNTGKGIPPEMVSHVFDPFFRGDQSHSNTVEGCGLGLSIVRWIVTAHGGSIKITSDVNKTTKAVVVLPA